MSPGEVCPGLDSGDRRRVERVLCSSHRGVSRMPGGGRREEEHAGRESTWSVGAESLVLSLTETAASRLWQVAGDHMEGKSQRHRASPHWGHADLSAPSSMPARASRLPSHSGSQETSPNILLMLRAALVDGKCRIYCSISQIESLRDISTSHS